jgi:hypothetical protein
MLFQLESSTPKTAGRAIGKIYSPSDDTESQTAEEQVRTENMFKMVERLKEENVCLQGSWKKAILELDTLRRRYDHLQGISENNATHEELTLRLQLSSEREMTLQDELVRLQHDSKSHQETIQKLTLHINELQKCENLYQDKLRHSHILVISLENAKQDLENRLQEIENEKFVLHGDLKQLRHELYEMESRSTLRHKGGTHVGHSQRPYDHDMLSTLRMRLTDAAERQRILQGEFKTAQNQIRSFELQRNFSDQRINELEEQLSILSRKMQDIGNRECFLGEQLSSQKRNQLSDDKFIISNLATQLSTSMEQERRLRDDIESVQRQMTSSSRIQSFQRHVAHPERGHFPFFPTEIQSERQQLFLYQQIHILETFSFLEFKERFYLSTEALFEMNTHASLALFKSLRKTTSLLLESRQRNASLQEELMVIQSENDIRQDRLLQTDALMKYHSEEVDCARQAIAQYTDLQAVAQILQESLRVTQKEKEVLMVAHEASLVTWASTVAGYEAQIKVLEVRKVGLAHDLERMEAQRAYDIKNALRFNNQFQSSDIVSYVAALLLSISEQFFQCMLELANTFFVWGLSSVFHETNYHKSALANLKATLACYEARVHVWEAAKVCNHNFVVQTELNTLADEIVTILSEFEFQSLQKEFFL